MLSADQDLMIKQNDNYLKCQKLLHQLFKVRIENDDEESEEEDKILDEMDIVWYKLTEQEKRSIEQFDEDLRKDYK